MISKEQYQEAIKTINEYNSQKDTTSFKEGFIKWISRYFNRKVKTIKLTKSKILQMDYAGIPTDRNVEVLGWVNLGEKKYSIIKSFTCYYRAEVVVNVSKEEKCTQFQLEDGGYEWPPLTVISCQSANRGNTSFSPKRDDSQNIQLYNHLISFKRKCEIAGQIYY